MELFESVQARWRKSLFQICVVLVILCAIAEIVIYCIDSASRELFLPLPMYRMRFIYLPSALNIGAILLTKRKLSHPNVSNRAKNRLACYLIWFICANVQLSHYVYAPLLVLPNIAIFVSVLFADKALTRGLSIASSVSIVLSCCIASKELRAGDVQLLSDMGLAILVIFGSFLCANLLISYVKQQIDFILSSNQREQLLLEKLQLDGLMGIYNRKKMEQVIRSLTEQYDPQKGGLCLLMLDLDNFKSVNDTYGHLCGDQVLLTLADVIRSFGTKNIIACRYGGEEVVVILKQTDWCSAYAFANDLLARFRLQHYAFAPELLVTFSCGISVYEVEMTRDTWIRLADEALYRAKGNGRNQVQPVPDTASLPPQER